MYDFAENKLKLERAIKSAGSTDEQSVLKEYIRFGGKITRGYVAKSSDEVVGEISEIKQVEQEEPQPIIHESIEQHTRDTSDGDSTDTPKRGRRPGRKSA